MRNGAILTKSAEGSSARRLQTPTFILTEFAVYEVTGSPDLVIPYLKQAVALAKVHPENFTKKFFNFMDSSLMALNFDALQYLRNAEIIGLSEYPIPLDWMAQMYRTREAWS